MQNYIWNYILCAVVGYLLGSLSTGIILSKTKYRKDIRDYGSNNAGMTNMMRTFGKGAAAITFIFDFLKGGIAALLAKYLLCGQADPLVCAFIAAFFAVLGHVFPVFFKFRGGKGAATAIGVTTVMAWQTFPIVMGLFFIVVALSKMVSLASILCSVWMPFATYMIYTLWYPEYNALVPTISTALMAVLVIFMHRSNIKRIIHGEERKIGQHKKEEKTEEK